MSHKPVVEDDPLNIELISDLPELYGYEVTDVKDGIEVHTLKNHDHRV